MEGSANATLISHKSATLIVAHYKWVFRGSFQKLEQSKPINWWAINYFLANITVAHVSDVWIANPRMAVTLGTATCPSGGHCLSDWINPRGFD